MSEQTAQRWVVISALAVAAVYAYRRMIEPSAPPATLKKLAGIGELPPLGSWATAWGFTFLVVSVVAAAAPGLGAGFAILIATSDLLTNSQSVFADVAKQESAQSSSAAATRAGETATVTSHAPGTKPAQAGASSIAGATATGIGNIGSTVTGGL